MNFSIDKNALRIECDRISTLLKIVIFRDGERNSVPLTASSDGWNAKAAGTSVTLKTVQSDDLTGRIRFSVSIETDSPSRVEFVLAPEGQNRKAFHIVPGFIFGDNNLAISGPNHFPNLTDEKIEGPSCSPSWSMRTDRAAAPVSMALFDEGGYVAIAGPPYLDIPGGFIKTGLSAALPCSVGYAVGYANLPFTFRDKNKFGEPTEAAIPAEASIETYFDIFISATGGRDHAFDITREIYQLYYEPPTAEISTHDAIRAISDAVLIDTWDEEKRLFISCAVKGLPGKPQYRKVGGRAIAWVGGVNVAYPLLAAGYSLGDDDKKRAAKMCLDRIAENINPASGLFFDSFSEEWKPDVNYWWSGISNKDLHSAYTNAEAAYYMLKATLLIREQGDEPSAGWAKSALSALNTMLELQREDGHYGYAYYTDSREVADWEGFAGCWFVPAMCLAHKLTGDAKYLESARRGIECYGDVVRTLHVWGTPMDTYKGNDEEGVLAFIRGAALLHEITGEDRYVEMMRLGTEYEFLWRYMYNARPDAEPLRSANWQPCGGSITSVSNPHIHPMGLLIAGDLLRLYRETGDVYFLNRLRDSQVWARNCLDIHPEKSGYGRKGWTGERYCPSDGLLIQKFEDGSPSSIEHSFNLWAASAFLEGMLEAGEDTEGRSP